MENILLVRYGEISLKGRNRSKFEDILVRNIKNQLQGLAYNKIEKTFGRIYIKYSGDQQLIIEGLQKVFGIVSISPVIMAELDFDAIKQVAVQLMEPYPNKSFKVNTRRPNKKFEMDSMEISRLVGGYVLQNIPGLSVDVHNPEIQIDIEIRNESAYLYNSVIRGLGGMPVGSSSKALLLLSGGIDSPVAGYLSLKRGVNLEGLHFYSYPFTSERSKQKVIDLARHLTNYTGTGEFKLWIAYFTEIQKALQRGKFPDLNITIMRRMMLRIGERLAKQERALALVTGDSLGQVASQTMESIATINAVTNMPIFRPLIGMDKQEIVDLSRQIGTYSTSILPYEDCCTVFVPRNPATKPKIEQALEAEAHLDVEGLVEEAVAKTELVRVTQTIELF